LIASEKNLSQIRTIFGLLGQHKKYYDLFLDIVFR